MNPINALSVQRAVEVFLRDRLSVSLTQVSLNVYGRDPGQLSRAEFGLMIRSLKAAGWRQHTDPHTRARYWRGPQQAAQTPISAPEDIDDAQGDTGRQWAA